MVQRSISVSMVRDIFERFIRYCSGNEFPVAKGGYAIFGRPRTFDRRITVRIDIDEVDDETGKAHTVTVFVGRGDTQDAVEIVID